MGPSLGELQIPISVCLHVSCPWKGQCGQGSHRPHVGTAPGDAALNGEVGHRGKEERPREQSRVRVGGGGGYPSRRAVMLPPVALFP